MEDAGGPAGGQSGLLPDQESGDLQIAQATIAGARGDAIGIVNEATGDVFIVHKDGTSEQAVAGMPVFADDIVATGTDGAVEVVFKDGTTFSLGSNGQMRLDNLIYDPAGNDNGLDATIVKGSFVFITGNVGSAEGEGVSIDTPAGTIGIRGTSGGVAQDPQTGTWIFTLFRDPDGTLSRFVVTNPAGQQLLDQEFETTEVAGRLIAPSQTIVLSPAQAAALFAGALQLLEQQFPQLQRSELENVNPAAGEEQFAVDPGQLPPSAESLAELFGLDALGDALAELLGNDEGQNWGEARSVATSTFVPAAQSSPIILGSDDNAATEDGGTNPIGNVLDNDTDVTGGAVLGVSAVNGSPANVGEPTAGTFGTLQLNADGTYVYTLDNDNDSVQALGEGQTATDVFTYTVSDGLGHTATATLTITVTGTNDLPVAEADVNAAPEDTGPNPVSGNVLANDKDVDNGDQLTVSTVNESADNVGTPIEGTYGTLQLNANGSYSYTLDNSKDVVQALGEGKEATDEFSYTISDGHGGSATATLTITVTGTNDDPVANPDEATTAEDTPVTISVLANDSDLDGDPLTVTQATALHGTVSINDDGTLTYTPAADYNGPDTISYSIDDGHGGTAGSTVAVTVTATNDAPVANPDAATTAEDTPVTIAVLDNDTDTENDVLTVTQAAALHGTVVINDDGTLTYTPAADYNGPDTITYSIDDGNGGTAGSTVSVTVTAVNDDPVANPDEATTAEDTPVTIAVLDNDTDVDFDDLTISGASALHGTVAINDDGTLTYTPAADYNGPDTITYSIDDGLGGTAKSTVAVTVTAVNDDPVANPDEATTAEDTPVTIAVLDNDTDTENDALTVTAATALHGTVVINDDGTLTYAPAADYNGPDTITYSIADGHGGTAGSTVAVAVTAVNDDPVANPDEATTAEDTPVTIAVLDNDTDTENDALTVTAATALHGTVTINDDGTLTYTPAADYNGPDTITYSIDDGHGGTAASTVAVTVTGINDDPVANPDEATTAEDTPVTIAVLDNDTDVDGDDLTISGASALHGTVVINDDGTLTYTPAADYNGPDTISYNIDDGHGGTAASTVAVTVTAVNDDPVANPDAATTAEDTPVTIAVLDNDTDTENDALTVTAATALHGTVVINDDGTLTYAPAADYNGPDTISYSIDDGHGGTAASTVAVTVTGINDDPVANPDEATTAEDTPVTIAVLDNDTDVDGDDLTISGASALHGTVTINGDGTLTYTPAADYNGPDTITYSIDDGHGGTAVSTVAVAVTAVNDDPVANPDAATTAEDTPVTIAVLDNDTDTENDALTVTAATALHGTIAINDDSTLTYTPAADYNGPDTISYSIDDGHGGTAASTVAVTVTGINDDPVANPDEATTAEDTPVTIAVLDNDTDVDGDDLTISGASALHGTVTINGDGTLTYTPAADYNGPDTITYSIDDGHGGTAGSTVSVTVTAVNDDPVANPDAATTAEDTPVTIAVLDNDTDTENDVLTVTAATALHGTVAINNDGTLTYTPAADYNGPDTITYSIDDGLGGTAKSTVAVTVTAVNDDPVANPDEATTAEDTPVTIAVLDNDTDTENDALTVTAATALHGTVVINDDGTLTYMPAADYNGPDTITYSIDDGHGGTAGSTVSVTVTAVNDDPVANPDAATTAEDTPVTIAVLDNDTDTENDALTVTAATALHGTVAINDDGTLTYTPAADYNGPDTITYSIADGNGGTAESTVAVTVTAVNDAPVAAADAYSTDEDTVLTVPAPGVLSNDTDVDGDKLSAVLVEGPAHGTLEFGADGSFVYTPTGNFNGEDSFSYQADDGSAGSEPVTVILSVNAVNDAPVAKDDKATTAEDTSLILTAASLLANDTDADSDALTILSVGAAAHGTVTLNKDGSVSYAPNADYNGPDSFSYTVSDGHGGTSTAQVNLTVTPVNDPPAAQDDSYHVVQGKTLTVNAEKGVLVNDTDVEGDTLTVTGVSSQPAHGELTLNADGSFSYTPNGDYEGTDTFTYKVSDGQGGTAEAKVTIVIDDSVPKAAGESVKTADTAPKTVDLVIILDRSGSMNDPSGVAGVSTRLELARAAIAALFEAYQSIADLHIQIVDFADGAASSGWLSSPEAANAYLASLVASGGTNYAAALEMAMAAYDGAPPADQTEVYFLSDGAPTQSLTAAQIAEWEGFLDTNDVDKALAVGIGAGIQSNDPDLAAVAYPNGDAGNPIVVTQTSQLIATLVGTVDNPISGNVLTNDDFGADGKGNGGGGLLSIKVGDVTYSFDGKNILNEATGKITAGAILVVEPTLIGGLLEFDFDSGDYTFTPPDVTATKFEEFEYTIVDGDGDQDKAVLHIDITDSGITVVDPSVIFGTDASKATNDNLAGTTRDDIMSGGAGNDTVSGGEGNDHIQGGAGTDALLGGAGIDILIGGAGNDTLDGGAGANALVGGDGDDRIVVGAGDRADGGGGNDSFILVDNAGFAAIQGGGTTELSLSADGGDVLAFNGTLDITKFAADKILGIETISMADGLGGAGADKLVINAGDVMDIGSGQLNPAGAFGAFGELPNAAAIRVNGDDGDSLTLSGSGWQQVTSGPGGVPGGYVLYVHDSPADGAAADAYVLVQTAVKVTTG